jgi:hypothetical protein
VTELGLIKQQNRCIEIIAMTENKIGEELVKGRAEGRLLKAGEYHQKCGKDANRTPKAAIAELGLTKQQNRCIEVVALAEKKIGEELERGRAEGKIAKANEQIRRWADHGRDADRDNLPATIAELGLTKLRIAASRSWHWPRRRSVRRSNADAPRARSLRLARTGAIKSLVGMPTRLFRRRSPSLV